MIQVAISTTAKRVLDFIQNQCRSAITVEWCLEADGASWKVRRNKIACWTFSPPKLGPPALEGPGCFGGC